MHASVQLKTGSMERIAWTQTYDRAVQDVAALESDVARAVAREIQIQLTPQEQRHLSGCGREHVGGRRGRGQLVEIRLVPGGGVGRGGDDPLVALRIHRNSNIRFFLSFL